MSKSDLSFPLTADGFPQGSLPRIAAPLSDIPGNWNELTRGGAAAVLMLLVPPQGPEGVAEVVFTRRTTIVGSHKGQIGFPGGRAEDSDGNPSNTALRETSEELGVDPARIKLKGMLPLLHSLDGGLVAPLLGLATIDVGELVPCPREVDFAFSVPWTRLTHKAGQSFRFNIFGHWRESQLFTTTSQNATQPSLNIWGLTAKIVHSADMR